MADSENQRNNHHQQHQNANNGISCSASGLSKSKVERSRSTSRSRILKQSDISHSENLTLYMSGQKASQYQSKMSDEGHTQKDSLESNEVVSIRSSASVIKCDSDKEINSLKRKKVPSVSLSESVPEQEQTYASVVKQIDKENVRPSSMVGVNPGISSNKRMKMDPLNSDSKIVASKPPIPPKPDATKSTQHNEKCIGKSKKQVVSEAHNALTVQKLLAQNEQMRLEINDLRSNLATERNAVRVLRAQNESDLRRTKTECKKLQEALSHKKRNGAVQTSSISSASAPKRPHRTGGGGESASSDDNVGQVTINQLNLDILKLNQELSAMRETNKFLEEKIQISSEAERRKASDIRVQRDLHELRLTQLTKSAKSEIQRLLEELKSKDRSIGLLKKEISALQGGGGGAKKERKAAINSAQQSLEMRKLRESESTCSGNISKSTSHSSIHSVCDEPEQNDAEADPVAAPGMQSTVTLNGRNSTSSLEPTNYNSRNNYHNYNQATKHYSHSNSTPLGLETTTCGDDDSTSKPHESRTMEAHNDVHASARLVSHQDDYDDGDDDSSSTGVVSVKKTHSSEPSVVRTTMVTTDRQLSTVSDADSAISSAPPSLSPQTTSCPNSPEVWRAHIHHQQQSEEKQLQSLRDESQLKEIKLELDRMQTKYDLLSANYSKAKEQIDDLERELMEAAQAQQERAKYAERIDYLEQREENLLRESHELREQNELLEFRIIELEESHDKWSLRSNSSPTVGSGSINGSTTKDVWTDTDKEHDDMIMHSERSDSGVTSPNSHHHLEDQQTSGVPSPCCDLSLLDQIPTDDVRKRIVTMTKRACYDEEDKMCLMQILSLLNNLEALSQDHEIANEEMSLEMPVKYNNYSFPESQPPKSLTATSTPFKSQQGKMVATVQPFSNNANTSASMTTSTVGTSEPKSFSIASIAETFGGMKKSAKWGSTSLQESGVFVDEMMVSCVGTQTEVEDFPCLEKTNAELCAEIEKLNRFRQKIEECTIKKNGKNPVGVSLSLPAESCEQRRLQYYVNRMEQLENKVKVYESSGDQQLRHLADRLQREIQLESWVDQLSEKVNKLEDENEQLEEERCELEEIENDTRLRLQRMEVDYEMMSQRNTELEMSKSSYQSKYQDARDSLMNLEELVHKCEERIFVLEETENELNDRIDLILAFIPVLLMFNSWQLQEQMAATRKQYAINYIAPEHIDYYESTNGDLQMRLNDLMNREKELTQNIAELNRAYNETLENADNLWAQMEKEYKDKISKCEMVELNLKSKIGQLEERLSKDSEYAHERISYLEEAENSLKNRVSKLNKENKDLIAKHAALLEEYTALKDEYCKLQNYLKGTVAENLDKEKRKIVTLEEELTLSTKLLKDVEEHHKSELGQMRGSLLNATKELNHIEVTNSELREEVETLEVRIRELLTLRNSDEECIKHLTEELQSKQAHISQLQQHPSSNHRGGFGRSLAQELERPVKGSYSKLGYEIHPLSRKFPGDSDSSGSEDKVKFPVTKAAPEAKEVKSLAETIILNAENRGIRAPKKSFVEEARSRFARWV